MKRKARYVWCAEDDKYGLMGVYATKKAADTDIKKSMNGYWMSGYGGTVIKRKVQE